MLTIGAVAWAGACSTSVHEQAYRSKDSSLAEAVNKDYDVYVLGSAPVPSRPQEVPAWFADDDEGTDFVTTGGAGYRVVSHRKGSYGATCGHVKDRTCLHSVNGVLAEDVEWDEHRSVVTGRSYTLYTRRDETVVEVPLGMRPSRGAAWWTAALVDADLREWRPSSAELQRLDELSTGG